MVRYIWYKKIQKKNKIRRKSGIFFRRSQAFYPCPPPNADEEQQEFDPFDYINTIVSVYFWQRFSFSLFFLRNQLQTAFSRSSACMSMRLENISSIISHTLNALLFVFTIRLYEVTHFISMMKFYDSLFKIYNKILTEYFTSVYYIIMSYCNFE